MIAGNENVTGGINIYQYINSIWYISLRDLTINAQRIQTEVLETCLKGMFLWFAGKIDFIDLPFAFPVYKKVHTILY